MKIEAEEFRIFSKYIHELSGLVLDDNKTYLIETRLGSLAKEQGCTSFSELYYKARADITKALPGQIIDAMATNETLFFRDTAPFEMLQQKIMPDLLDKRSQRSLSASAPPLRIWSAACSTGQEIYSIAIILKAMLADRPLYNLRLLGTDISNRAVAQASRGVYNRVEIERGLPPDKLHQYFTVQDGQWKIQDEIRAMATFRTLNLLENFSGLGKFDIIFCRNVAIYFSQQDKVDLFERLAHSLEPDGYLVIGSTESITGTSPQFIPQRHMRSVFYQLKK